MRIYSLQAPDGNIYDLQAPEGASEQELTATLYALKPEAAQPFAKESGVIAQGKKGIEQLVSGFQTTGEVALGDKNEAARNALARQAEFDRKYEQSPSLDRTAEAFKQKGFFSGLGQLASDAPEVLSANLPQIGASYAGGKAGVATGSKLGSVFGPRGRAVGAFLGGAAGTLGVNYPSQLSGNVETQAEEQVSKGKPIDINVPAAAVTAIPQAAAEAVANSIFLGRGVLGKMLGLPESFLMKGGAASVEKLAQESLAATVAKGTATGFAAEFPAEIFQQVLQRYQAGQPLTSPEAYKQYAEIAYQTALLSPLGTAGRSLDKRGAKAQVQQKAYEEQQIADAEAQKAAQEVAPPQPQDIAGRYQAAEKRKAELKAQIRKVEEGSVTETADRLYNKELEEQIKAMAPELEQLATEYNQFQKTAPAPEAAAGPEITVPEEIKPTRALTVGDSLDNPLGRFTKEELTSRSPKIAAYVDAQRKKMGKPSLNDYSIEDIRDAMPGQLPEAEKADLNSLIAAKTGHTGEVIYKPEDVVNIAKQKNINTDTVGFKYFLQRATGDNDLSNMSQPQLHSAFKSLSELPKYEETQNLPEKSSATHYSPEQYQKAVDRIKSLTTDGILPSAKAQEVAKQASGLKRDSDVQYMLQSAYRNGDLDLDSNGNFIRVNPVPQSEFRVEEGFEPAEPTGFNVMRGDKVLFSTQNEAEAKAKAKTLGDSAAPTIKQVEKSIANEQKALDASQRSLDAMEVNGLFGTPEYNKASAKHTALVEESAKKVGELSKTKEYLQQEVTVKTGKKAANVKAFTTKEKGVSEKSFATREEALQHAIENHTVARLNEIAAETKSPGLKARISKELERRKNPKPFLAAEKPEPVQKTVEKPAEEPLVTAQKESIKSQLLPMLKKFGLGDVALQIEAGMKEEGSYGASLVKVALDANNPIRVLRHESIHGLKDLGFFAPGQWKVLENQADKVWIDKYLKERNIDGRPLEAGQQSRYDAYYRLYKGDEQAIREEAIADAFGDFDVNGAPKGLFTTLLNNMRKFFEALRNSFNGAGYMTSDDVFGKIERGELSAGNKAGVTEKPSVRNTNKGLLNPNISPKYEKIINDVANEMELTPEEFASTSLINQTGKAGVDQFESNKIGGLPEVIQFLQDQRRNSGLPLLDIEKPADRKIVAKLMATETMAAIRSGGANLEWYDSTINKTLAMAGLKYQELNTDINARVAFRISTAITSQGLNVEDNLKFAMKVYDQFRLNNKFPEIGQGADQGAMTSNFKLANYLMEDMGPNLMRQFLETEFTVEEMRSAGFNIAGELGDEKVLGSSVFGPKIGFGFYSNLNGNFDPVTMDMWFMRTIGRLTGKLKSFRQDLYDAQLDKFKNELDTEGSNGVFANQFDQNEIDLAKVDDKAAEDLARKVKSAHERDYKINRAAYDDGTREKSKLVAASEIMIKSLDSPKDAPANGSERRNLRDVVRQMADIVEQKYGKRVPPASLQAAIWYPEQELYKSMGVKLRVTSQNYAGAIEKILTGEGYGESDLSAAAKLGSRTTQQLAKSAVAKGTQATGTEPVRLGPLKAEEKEALLERGRKRVVLEEEKETPKRKRVIFEVAPDPNNKALTAKWKSLSNDERVEISEKIGNTIVKNALNKFGLKGYVDTQIGSYLDDTNPSFALYLESGDSVAMANFLGYALSQDSMMVVSPKAGKGLEKTGAVRIKIGDASARDVDKIYQQLREIEVDGEKPVGGQSYMNGHMVVLNYSNVPTNQLASLIESKLGGDYEVITEDVYTAFPDKKDYDYANSSSDPRGNSGVLRQDSRDLRSEATRLLQKELAGRQKSIATSPAAKAAGNLKNVVTDKTLLEAQTELNQYDENLFNEQVTPAQRSRANEALAPYMSLAEQEKPAFDAMVERIGNDVGIQVRPDPIKNIVRAAEKLVLETENGTKNPDASLILDLLRTTIVVNNEAEIPNAIKEIKKSFDVVRVKDRFKNPALTGYRDFLVNVKLPSGLIAEIQVNIPAMIGSKSTGHKLYRMSRNMEQGSSKRTYLEGLSRRLYNEAYRFSQNDISAASARDALLRKTSEGKALFGSSAKTTEPSSSLRTGVASTAQTVAPFGTSNITSPTKNGSITKASLRTAPDTPEFKRFFGDSRVVNADGTPKVMYHGTAQNITEFKPRQAGAIFLTENPKFADEYAETSSISKPLERDLSEYSPQELAKAKKQAIADVKASYGFTKTAANIVKEINSPKQEGEALDFIKLAADKLFPAAGQNVMPVFVSAQKPFDYENPAHVKALGLKGINTEDLANNVARLESDRVQNAIRAAGFDSFYIKQGNQKNIGVYSSTQIKSATGNIGTYDATNPDIRYSLREFRKDDLPKDKKTYTIPANTTLFHGSHKTQAEQIETAGRVLRSRSDVKASGGYTNEGGLIFFGDSKTAEDWAKNRGDPMSVRFDQEAGVIRDTGTVFQTITDKPYRLIKRRYELSASEAAKVTEALGLPEYKSLSAGDTASLAADRGDNFSNSKAPRYEVTKAGRKQTMSAPWPIIFDALGVDGYFDDFGIAISAKNGIRLEGNDGKMERYSLSSAPDWVPQKIWDLHEKANLVDDMAAGRIAIPNENRTTRPQDLKREQTMSFRRLSKAVEDHVGKDWKDSQALMTRMGEETNRRERDKSEQEEPRYSLRTNVTEDIKNMPNGAAIDAAINRTTQARQEVGFVERITAALAPESFSYLRQKGLDRYNRLSDVERLVAKKMGGVERLADSNAHSAALQSDLAAGVAASALGVGDRIGGIPVYKDGYTTVSNEGGTIKGAVAIFAPLARYGDPKIYQTYQFWAASKRGKRLLESGREELFTPQEFAYAKQLEQKYPEFVSVQKDWIKYNDGLVKYLLDTGVISAQNAAEFVKYSDYLPFYRQIDGERTIGPNIFQSISGVKAPKGLSGKSEAPLADFLETIVRNTQASIQAGMKNVAAKKAADAGVFIGLVEKLDHVSSSPSTITILEKGKKVSYECADRLWVDAVSSLNLPELPFLSIFAKPADILRNLVTKDPGFMLANLMRDSVSAYVTSGANITPLVSTMKEFGSVLMNSSPEYQKLLSAGVLGGYEFSRDIEASTSEFAKDIRKKTGTKTTFETAASPFTLFWGALEKGTTASDAATRIAIYKATLKETGNEAEALHRSLEVLNFNRKGSSAVVRIAAAVIPFLNARVQGLDVFFRSGIRPFFNKDATAMEKQVQKAMFVRGATIMAMSTMYAAAIAGNPDYENQEEEVKDNNWIIPLGEGRAPLKIPTPFEVGTLFKTIPERIYRSFYGMDTNKDSAEAAKRALSNTFGISPMPQIISPLIEAKTNYSMFTHREIVSGNMKDVAPEYQVGANTSKVAQEIGMATGMSPIKLEYVYKGYTGTMGMYALDVLDASITSLMPNSGVQRASKRFEQMPVIKRFLADPDARGKITAYYDLKNSVDSVVRTINFLEKSNDPSIADYAQKNAMLYAAKDFINDLNKEMQDLQDQANMIRSADIPADQKRDILLEITKAQNLLVNDIRAIRKVIQP
jgi:hypothetical protein